MAEAAGLVLAALPLIVEGLRGYLRGIESIKKFWQYAKLLKRLIRKFQVEQRKFGNTCTELLMGLVNDAELSDLLEEPGGIKWQTKSLQLSLRKRLGASYQVFFDAVSDMTEIIEEFEEKLELNQEQKPRWLEYSSCKREWKRVLFGLAEEANDSLIRRLEQSNKDLQELLGHGLRMESLRLSKNSTYNAKYYERVHECAKGLYNILRHSFTSWPCGCVVPHKANLRLEARQQALDRPDIAGNINFNVVFSFETEVTTAEPLPWTWCETTIETVCYKDRTDILVADPDFTSKPGRKKVAFASLDIDSPGIKEDQSEKLPTIGCLCEALNTRPKHNQGCLGILVDQVSRSHRITIANASNNGNMAHTVSLMNLLTGASQLERRERLALGVKLASTLLQLHQTPWLPKLWGKRDVIFPRPSGEPFSSNPIQTPLVARHFSPPTCTLPARQMTDSSGFISPEVRNHSIFALGVLLIELWYHKPLELLRIPDDLGEHGEANQLTDFATARRLTEEIYRDAGDWYGHAVRRCIYCEFDQRNNDLSLSAMKEAVHQGVLEPLQENLISFCGGKADELLA